MNECLGVPCPYCGEQNFIEPEPSEMDTQYIEDCTVCCRPIVYWIQYSPEGSIVEAKREDD